MLIPWRYSAHCQINQGILKGLFTNFLKYLTVEMATDVNIISQNEETCEVKTNP